MCEVVIRCSSCKSGIFKNKCDGTYCDYSDERDDFYYVYCRGKTEDWEGDIFYLYECGNEGCNAALVNYYSPDKLDKY